MYRKKLVKKLKKLGYRSATLEELLALGAQHQHLQHKYRICTTFRNKTFLLSETGKIRVLWESPVLFKIFRVIHPNEDRLAVVKK